MASWRFWSSLSRLEVLPDFSGSFLGATSCLTFCSIFFAAFLSLSLKDCADAHGAPERTTRLRIRSVRGIRSVRAFIKYLVFKNPLAELD